MISQLLSGRSRLIVHLTGWLLVFVSFYYLISEFRGPEEVWLRSCLNMGFMLVLFYGNAKWLVNRYLEKGRYGRLVGLTILFCRIPVARARKQKVTSLLFSGE